MGRAKVVCVCRYHEMTRCIPVYYRGQHKSMSGHMRGPVPDHMFGQILREASSQGDTRDCPVRSILLFTHHSLAAFTGGMFAPQFQYKLSNCLFCIGILVSSRDLPKQRN